MEEGKITRGLLKTRSGEFDLESIHSLNLMDLGIYDLGCICECTYLQTLNLSKNEISKLTKLAGLSNLTRLNLSGNRIISLEGLQSLDSLQSINLAGNLIGGVDSFHCLTGLNKLQNITLQDRSKGLSNPLCVNDYRKEIMKMFPNLKTLDGERVHGRGSEVFNMFHEIEEAINLRGKGLDVNSIPKAVEYVPEDFWIMSNNFEKTNLSDAEDQLKALLFSCKDLEKKAENTLDIFKKSHQEQNLTDHTFITSDENQS